MSQSNAPKRTHSRPALDVSTLFADTPNDRIRRAHGFLVQASDLLEAAGRTLHNADVPKIASYVREGASCVNQAIQLAEAVTFDEDVHDRPTIRTHAASVPPPEMP